VKFGKSFFLLNRGLPQGLSISPVLSSYFYSKIEESHMGNYIKQLKKKNELFLIMRLTDDYIIFSDSK